MNRELYRYYVIDRVHRGLRTEWKSQEPGPGHSPRSCFWLSCLTWNVCKACSRRAVSIRK